MHFSRFLKVFIALGFIAVLCLIIYNFVSRSQAKIRIPEGKEVDLPKKQETRELEYSQVTQGSNADIKFTAEKHYLGEDGLYHLVGDVQLQKLNKEGEEKVSLKGDEVTYDKDMTQIRLSGRAAVDIQGMTARSDSIEYSEKDQIYRSSRGVEFASSRINGKAGRLEFSEVQQTVRLLDGVEVDLLSNLDDDLPVTLKSQYFDYRKAGKQGSARGEIQLVQGESRASAASLEYVMTPDEEFLRELILNDGVQAVIIRGEGSEGEEQDDSSFSLHASRREVEAGSLYIQGFVDLSQVHFIKATEGALFKFWAADGAMTEIRADSIDFVLARSGKLREFHALKGAVIIERDTEGREIRRLEGDTIVIKDKKDVLEVSGGESKDAFFLFDGNEISARDIRFNLDDGGFEAHGGVGIILQMKEKEGEPSGFFSAGSPVYVSTDSVRYYGDDRRFHFKGTDKKIKIWQDDTSLQAEDLILNEETGEIRCQGEVISVFMFQASDSEERRQIRVSAERMNFDPDERRMSFDGRGKIQVSDVTVQAKRVWIRMSEEKGKLIDMLAESEVRFLQGRRTGEAKKAHYDLEKEVIILTGDPEIEDLDKGKFQGDKLTFHLADDRIVVENKGQERSVTVIK